MFHLVTLALLVIVLIIAAIRKNTELAVFACAVWFCLLTALTFDLMPDSQELIEQASYAAGSDHDE